MKQALTRVTSVRYSFTTQEWESYTDLRGLRGLHSYRQSLAPRSSIYASTMQNPVCTYLRDREEVMIITYILGGHRRYDIDFLQPSPNSLTNYNRFFLVRISNNGPHFIPIQPFFGPSYSMYDSVRSVSVRKYTGPIRLYTQSFRGDLHLRRQTHSWISLLRSFCDRYAVRAFQDPGSSTSIHLKILSLQSCSDVCLRSCRDDFAPTESVRLQEMIPTQLGRRRSVLKIVPRLPWEHIPNTIICVGASRSIPLAFYNSLCAPFLYTPQRRGLYIIQRLPHHTPR